MRITAVLFINRHQHYTGFIGSIRCMDPRNRPKRIQTRAQNDISLTSIIDLSPQLLLRLTQETPLTFKPGVLGMSHRFMPAFLVLPYTFFSFFSYSADVAPHAHVVLPQPEAYYSGNLTPTTQQDMVALARYQQAASLALPSVLSTLSASMKDPYVLLVAGAGTCLAYVMTGASPEPIASPERMLGLTQENMLVVGKALLEGLSYGSGVQSKRAIEEHVTSYAKPILYGGALTGMALAYTTLSTQDHPYAVSMLNNALLGLLPSVLTDVSDALAKVKGLLPSSKEKPSIKNAAQVIKNKAQRSAWKKKVTHFYNAVSSDYVVAFVSFGTVLMLQTDQSGSLDDTNQALALATLASATELIQKTVAAEYGSRAAGYLWDTVATGLSKAAHFSKRAYNIFRQGASSFFGKQQ